MRLLVRLSILLSGHRDFLLNLSTASEILAAVHTSLRRKVAGLAEDNWMFEAEHGDDDS